ncbi:MAG: DUF4335 domain-containing protein [Cyanobacteria bacterium]|nr:DUF4335 domain-containing protein [Cyanobacteriota bacterium]
MKLSLRYEQISCRLTVEGLPDVSTGQGGEAVGILTGWSLALAGHTELEGRREHLEALLQVVFPYARHLISGAPRVFGDADSPVAIHPEGPRHRLELRSSQPDTPPLTLHIDDAELADLVRCLDQLRLDPRLQLPLQTPTPQPLRRSELRKRVPLARRLAAPICGVAALGLAGAVSLMMPTPKPGSVAPAQGSRNSAVSPPDQRDASRPPGAAGPGPAPTPVPGETRR